MNTCLIYVILLIFASTELYAQPLRGQRVKRLAPRDSSRYWPNGVVPYTISAAFSSNERNVILRAMRDIESVSCARFKARSWEADYIDIVKPTESHCSSHVGKIGGRQKVNFAAACVWSNVVIHELLHVLGFEHEHERPDRDDYIRIHEYNIKPDDRRKFGKKSWNDFTAFGLPYDYDSIMHYKDTTFAIDSSKKSLSRVRSNAGIREGRGMSQLDIQKLNKLYPCPKAKINTNGATYKYNFRYKVCINGKCSTKHYTI